QTCALPICQCGSRRLVDDALDVETCDLAGVLGSLALRIVEISRNGDHGFRHLLAEIVLRGFFHLHQHACRDFGRRHLLAIHLDPGVSVIGLDDLVRHHVDVTTHDLVFIAAPYEALHCVQGVVRIRDSLALCRLADENFAILAERDDRRCSAIALAILDHLGLPALHDRDAGICGTQVDTDHFTHNVLSPKTLRKTVENCSNLALTWGLAHVFQAHRRQKAPYLFSCRSPELPRLPPLPGAAAGHSGCNPSGT